MSNVTETDPKSGNQTTDKPANETNIYYYILIGVVSVIVVMLLWFAYCKFISNAGGDEQTDSKDNLIADFDLRAEINEIERIQKQVLQRISQDCGI